MAIGVILNESTIALQVESTEGTYAAPGDGTDYIESLSDGLEMTKTIEEIERDVLGGTVEKEASRRGIPEVTGTIPVEFRASGTAGGAPQALDKQLRSLLGGKRQAATADTTTGATSTVLTFTSHPFLKGDSVLVKEAGAFEVRPISAITSTTITFPFALDAGAPADGVTVEAVTTYFSSTSDSVTLSAEMNYGGEIKDKVAGLRVNSGSLENFTVGQVPSMNFGLAGLSSDRSDATPDYAADFSADALPPVALEACLWISGVKLSYSELSLSIENEVAQITDACSANGKIGSRITGQTVSFTANPYADDTTFANYTNWDNNSDVSIFFYAYNPASTAGEFSEAVAVWMPQGKLTANSAADNEGLLTDAIEFKAHRSAGSDSIFMSFI